MHNSHVHATYGKNSTVPRNHIEFRNRNPEGPGHVAGRVFIDGTELLIAEHGVEISPPSADDIQTVTLKIIPHRISFN